MYTNLCRYRLLSRRFLSTGHEDDESNALPSVLEADVIPDNIRLSPYEGAEQGFSMESRFSQVRSSKPSRRKGFQFHLPDPLSLLSDSCSTPGVVACAGNIPYKIVMS